MSVAQNNEASSIPNYVIGLLKTDARKVCTTIGESIDLSHDVLYREFANNVQKQELVLESLQSIADENLSEGKRYLIFDDTTIDKKHAHYIEGLDVCFDVSNHRAMAGLQSVTVMLTDAIVRIPICAKLFVSKFLGGTPKSHIAATIISGLFGKLKFDRVLADAHYATKHLLHVLNNLSILFLMKFTSNRIVMINGKTGQLKNIFRLRRNEKSAYMQGIFDGMQYYFYAIKLSNGRVAYFISSDLIDKKQIEIIYKIRWAIECFHRTAKQHLGLGNCQMRSFEKQHLHIMYVMWAYAYADVIRLRNSLETTEDAIRYLRRLKTNQLRSSLLLLDRTIN